MLRVPFTIFIQNTLSIRMARVLFAKERRRASLIYRMNSNRGIFFRLATSGSESVSPRKHLEIPSIPFDDYSLGFQSGEKSEGIASGRIFRNEWRRLYGDGSIKIRAFPCLAFSTSSGRRYHVAGSALRLSSCVSCQFNFREKNKAPGVASFSQHRPVAFASGDSRERSELEPWEILARSIAQGQPALLMRGTRWRHPVAFAYNRGNNAALRCWPPFTVTHR